MPVESASSESFFDKYAKYTKDNKLNDLEYQDLKKSFMTENNASENDFNTFIAPALDTFEYEDITTSGAKDLIAKALADDKLSYDEYKGLKDYYMNSLGLSGEIFDSALDYIIRKDIIDYLKKNKDKEIEISCFKPKKEEFQDSLEKAIERAIAESIANDLVKMRTEDDFSEYTYRVLKAESDKTDVQASNNI